MENTEGNMKKYRVITFDTSVGYNTDITFKDFASQNDADKYCMIRSSRRKVLTAVPEEGFTDAVSSEKSI